MKNLDFPDFSIGVTLNNSVQTFNFVFILIPVWIDPRTTFIMKGSAGYYIRLAIYPKTKELMFYPGKASLSVDGKVVQETTVTQIGHDAKNITKAIKLKTNRPYIYTLYFDIKRPFPSQDITLDLSKSILHPDGFIVPKIHFEEKSFSLSTG